MTIRSETPLRKFEFWSGAKSRAELLTEEELDQIEAQLEEFYPDGMEDTQLNDLFWFDFDWVASLIGETEENILAREEEE